MSGKKKITISKKTCKDANARQERIWETLVELDEGGKSGRCLEQRDLERKKASAKKDQGGAGAKNCSCYVQGTGKERVF